MKKTIYKLQCNFHGGRTPTICTMYYNHEEAMRAYQKQSMRKDCSFCNLVKVEASVIAGENDDEKNAFTFI